MRLIDADALNVAEEVRAVCEHVGLTEKSIFEAFVTGWLGGAIDEAPTIEAVPVVRGEWIVTDAYPHRVYCSLCYKTNVPNEESLFERNEYPKFCMWCGAKMEDKP